MSRSNHDKPFYVDIGTSVVAIRCASNHDVILEYDFAKCPQIIGLTGKLCDRMNREAEIRRPHRNCDRFGGDIEKLREVCLSERGLNPDEDFPEVFCEWLLAKAKGGNDGSK